MGIYNYKALNENGIVINGKTEASDEAEVKDKLHRRGYKPIKITPVPSIISDLYRVFRRKPDIKQIAAFCRQQFHSAFFLLLRSQLLSLLSLLV
jgi:type II secretory pathway component PulF